MFRGAPTGLRAPPDNTLTATPAGVHYARYAMPYEDSLAIFIVRKRRTPIEQSWLEAKHFE